MRNTTEKLRAIIATTPYYYLKKGCYTKSCFHYLLLKNALCISLGVSLVGAGRGGGGVALLFLLFISLNVHSIRYNRVSSWHLSVIAVVAFSGLKR